MAHNDFCINVKFLMSDNWHHSQQNALFSRDLMQSGVKCRDRQHLLHFLSFLLKKILFIYFQREGREGERERNINVWLPLMCPLPPPPPPPLGTWPTTQACALTGNRTGNPLVWRPVLNPLSHTSQGYLLYFQRVRHERHISMCVCVCVCVCVYTHTHKTNVKLVKNLSEPIVSFLQLYCRFEKFSK